MRCAARILGRRPARKACRALWERFGGSLRRRAETVAEAKGGRRRGG